MQLYEKMGQRSKVNVSVMGGTLMVFEASP